jgi:hypothetical protein
MLRARQQGRWVIGDNEWNLAPGFARKNMDLPTQALKIGISAQQGLRRQSSERNNPRWL